MKNRLKKSVVVIISLILLVGCASDSIEKNSGNLNVEYDFSEYTFDDSYRFVDQVKGYEHDEIDILNNSTFDFKRDRVDIFYNQSKYIAFFDFNNYIENNQSLFEDEVMFGYDEKNSSWQVSYDISEDDEESEIVSIVYDFVNNLIVISDIGIVDNLYKSDESASNIIATAEELYKNMSEDDDSNSTEISKSESITIALDDYNLKMERIGDSYLIPSNVLLFTLSAYDNKLYFDGEQYVYTNIIGDDSIVNTQLLSNMHDVDYSKELIQYTTDFNTFVFDNFYGLANYNTSYMDNIDKTNTTKSYPEVYNDYIVELNDLHTSIYGYAFGGIQGRTDSEISFYSNYYSDYFDNVGCYGGSDEISINKVSDKTVIIEINGFIDDNFAEKYFAAVESVRGYENIVLDIKCNGGGYMLNSFVLLYPFTNDIITSMRGDIYGGLYEVEYEKKQDTELYDSNIYLVTSKYTFSAGNYAAILFKENNIGKIIGNTSGGGTAAVALFESPNGAVTSMSSGQSLIFDKNGNYVEDGVKVDIEYTFDSSVNYNENIVDIVENN